MKTWELSKLPVVLIVILCNLIESRNGSNFVSDAFDCPNEDDQYSYVLLCPSYKTGENPSFSECQALFSIEVHAVSIDICIESEQLLLPNASVTYVSKSKRTRSYPLDKSEALDIKFYFTGSVILLKAVYPFNGELLAGKLIGKSIIRGTVFVLKCNGFNMAEVNQCYKCQAFCSQFHNKNSESEISFDFEFLHNKGSLSEKNVYGSQVYKKMKLNQLSETSSQKRTCSLHLVLDHLFFKYAARMNRFNAINTMLKLVNKVNIIFRKTFNNNRGHNEIRFAVKHITVFQTETSQNYILGNTYLTSEEYLKKFSLYNFNSVCLAVGFTFRNFVKVFGQAFPAFPSSLNEPGGICEKRMKINSHHVSYNTLIMSFFHIQEKLSDTALALRLAHELGHSFGARHDETGECLPGNVIGNYIMSAALNKGVKLNNYLFSPCSIEAMKLVIHDKGQCLFVTDTTPLCGNSIPEYGEECDCGQAYQCEEVDPCCNPQGDMFHNPCTIKFHQHKQCSPKVSPCCNEKCVFVSSSSNPQCDPMTLRNGNGSDCHGHHCP